MTAQDAGLGPRLAGKVALITGAGMGMGREAAVLFARHGAKVGVADLNKAAAEETVGLIEKAGGHGLATIGDVAVEADVERMIAETVARFGGLHVLSCPDEALPHADALAIGEGSQVWPTMLHDIEHNRLQRIYRGGFTKPYRDDPAPRREILPRRSFLTTASLIATRGCHNRCGFCYLATDGLHMPYQMLDTKQVVEQFLADDQPYAVFIDNNLGSRPEYLRRLCAALRPLEKIWSAAVTLDVTLDGRQETMAPVVVPFRPTLE